MKLRLSLLLVLAALVAWQAVKLRQISDSDAVRLDSQSTFSPPGDASSNSSSRTLPEVPGTSSSAGDHRQFLRSVADLEAPSDQADVTELWVESLTSPAQLETALASLLEAPAGEREKLLRDFGPSLMSQWARIEPSGGLLAWARLDVADQWLIGDVDSELMSHLGEMKSPYPQTLMDTWAAHDPDGLISQLSQADSVFLSTEAGTKGLDFDLGRPFAKIAEQQDVSTLIRWLNALESRDVESPPLSLHAMNALAASRLVSEGEGVTSALEAARALPESPAQERIVMDLEASRLANQLLVATKNKETGGAIPPELAGEFLPVLRESSAAGRSQFLATLERSTEYISFTGNRRNELVALLKQLRDIEGP